MLENLDTGRRRLGSTRRLRVRRPAGRTPAPQAWAPQASAPQASAPQASAAPVGEPRADRLMRLIDVAVATVLLVVLAPPMLLIAALVRLTSSGPALFRQTRVGFGRQEFVMLKFRSMRVDCEDTVHRAFVSRMLSGEDPRQAGGGTFKLAGDRRITPIGRFLRVTSLDELPQLVNVVRGDMALVGPRPALHWEVELYQPHHHERFNAMPGITGLWQVSGRSRLTMSEALELDVEYVRRRSVALDLWILLKTLPAVLAPGAAR
jgi:lipopolysaccharide/colanic/teichoic acid biosynthesis glycosyltransferase